MALVTPLPAPHICMRKAAGKIAALEEALHKKPLHGTAGIAHTRWATHGAPTYANAHPHADCSGSLALVHNGIIENHEELKARLIKAGHRFTSQTDTEVIAHLIESFYAPRVCLAEAVRKASLLLHGSFALGVISAREPGVIVGMRAGSPLIVGVGKGENFIASDVPAVLEATREIIFLEENESVVLTAQEIRICERTGKPLRKRTTRIDWNSAQAQKGGYRHFMLKEINEQPRILSDLIRLHCAKRGVVFERLNIAESRLRSIRSIAIVACGTAYHAGVVGKYALESLCRLPTAVDVSSEFRYRTLLIGPQTLVLAVSQSGETADTLAGVREAKRLGAPVVAICNVLGSTLTREADGVIYTHAGPEIGVASTKAYTAQLVAFYLFTLYLAHLRGGMRASRMALLLQKLRQIPELQRHILKDQERIARLARSHSHFGSFLFLGRNINFPSALEGALKLKEISYIPAEGYAAGEMKHGPIALIDEYRAVVCIAPAAETYEKMISNIQEIRSRKGKIIAIATARDTAITALTEEIISLPATEELFSPLLVALPLQLLAYHIAVKRGCDVDQPRNLAKSVTVE